MLSHPLPNFEIQKYYQRKPRFNRVYSRDNLPDKIKDGAYVINADEYSHIGTHWIALYVLNNNVTCFDSFGIEHTPKEIKIFIDKSIVVANIFRTQAYGAIMYGYFCIGFINFMLVGKILTDFTNLFAPNNFKKNYDIILKYFMTNILKMVELNNSHETHNKYPNLNNQQQSRLNKINEIKDDFVTDIKERELMSKRLSKYIASFDYFEKSLIVLSVATGSISIASFATVIETPVGIASTSFSLVFSNFKGILKNC